MAGVDFSSVLLPPASEEEEEEKVEKEVVLGAEGLLRLLFIPTDDNQHRTKEAVDLHSFIFI